MKIIWLVLFLCFCYSVSAQECSVSSDRQRPIYLGIDNPLSIFVEGQYCRSVYVTVDNGTFEKDGCIYNYHPSRLGNAVFTLFKNQNGKRVKISTRKLYVRPIPKPVPSVGSYANGSAVLSRVFAYRRG